MLSAPSADLPPELAPLLEWFNTNVQKLETAYNELGRQFAAVNSELEHTNRLLEHNQRRLSALLTSMDTAVIMADPSGCLLELNQAAESLLAISAAECLGRRVGDLFSEESGVGLALRQALESGKEESQSERTLHLPSGDVPVAITARRVIDSDGCLVGAMETLTDLTDLKKMQAEVQQDRVLRALGEMAATVAHEIRNPLGGIGGYAGLLARGIPPEDPKRKLVDKIIGGVSSLNKIVGNLLVYTRKTILQKQKTDMVAWLDAILAHAEVEIGKDNRPVQLERLYPEAPVFAEIDPERLQQVVLNLLINAIQAVEGEGKVTIVLRTVGKKMEVQVCDTGKGIAPENLESIFTPFFTTKEQGTGLGLAIVRKIVELHEGEITVESTLGTGTCFRMVLPGLLT